MSPEPKSSSPCPRPVILISGYRGLAETLISRFSALDFAVSVCVRDTQKIPALRDRFSQVLFVAGDLANFNDCNHWIETTLKEFGRIDALINNAAVPGPAGKLGEIQFQDFERDFRINFLSPTYLCHKAIPYLKKQGRGVIINLSGGGATNPRPQFSCYATAKAAVVRLTETLAAEYPELGVYAMAPGSLMTPMIEKLAQNPEDLLGKEATEIHRRIKQGGDDPEKAANLAEWLVREKPQALSGKLISAIWDDYKNAPAYPEKTGWWTLRRIDEIAKKNIQEIL